MKIEYCSTEGKHHRIEQQECVGRTVSVSNKHESNESADASKKRDVAVEVKVPSKNRNTKGSDPKNEHVNKNVKESDSANESVKGLEAKDSTESVKGLEAKDSINESTDLKVGQKE
jgi:hypothetical protein